jgi:hypothetical protein
LDSNTTSLVSPGELVRIQHEKDMAAWQAAQAKRTQDEKDGKQDLPALPPAPVLGKVGLHANLTLLQHVFNRIIGQSLECCSDWEQDLDEMVEG